MTGPTETVAGTEAWASLIQRLVRGIERGGKQWTVARRKDSLARLLAGGSKNDPVRLQQRLAALVTSWDDASGAAVDEAPDVATDTGNTSPAPLDAARSRPAPLDALGVGAIAGEWPRVMATLGDTVTVALPVDEARSRQLTRELRQLRQRIDADGASSDAADRLDDWGDRARRLLLHRHHMLEQLHTLTHELSQGLVELAEDESWARGQCEAMREHLDEGLSARSVRSVSQLLAQTRERQRAVRVERAAAREALKSALQTMLHEFGELGSQTEAFDGQLSRYADAIEKADSLENLAGTVREMVEQTRSVQSVVNHTRERIAEENARANQMASKVDSLEKELKRLSGEVSTDPLTGVFNRRGLTAAHETECARALRDGTPLAVGLIDLDDFKKLNDSLGHAAGDQALVALAERARESLRPGDVVARFGGEEFVVLMPATTVQDAQSVLSRLQRALTAGLFLHENRPVLVTFSAGVTEIVPGEPLELSLERADEALYEAKRTGKNRTCVA